MKWHALRSICRRFLVTCILMALASACSTLPPPIPVNDIKTIRGKWQGSGTNAKIGLLQVRLTVGEDGQWEMMTDPDFLTYGNRFSGTARVDEGKIQFKTNTPGLSGTCTLHRWQDRRLLIFVSENGETRVDFQTY